MKKQNIKLIIWDFDGVIADTEKLWLENRMKLLNQRYGVNWDFETTNKYLGGMADTTKRKMLDGLNINTDDKFWEESMILDNLTMDKGFEMTPHVEDIFKLSQFKQCIATGGIMKKTLVKLKTCGADKYFNENQIFTIDMVKNGKPEPDLFLLAAEKMGFLPTECIVVEDSLAGMRAGVAAGMLTVGFIGSKMYNTPQNIKTIKALGINHIFSEMTDFNSFLLTLNL